MANTLSPIDPYVQQALAQDHAFQARIMGAMLTVAFQQLASGASTATSKTFARTVLASPNQYASVFSQWIVVRPNIISSNVVQTLVSGQNVISTDATDGALQSQISTDWATVCGG